MDLYISRKKTESFYTKTLNLALDIYTSISETNKTYVQIVYENGIFHKLIFPDKNEGDFNEDRFLQNYDMFRTKFRGILFDFHKELIWSFDCNFYLFDYRQISNRNML